MELYVRTLQRAVGSDGGTFSTHRLCQQTSLPTDDANPIVRTQFVTTPKRYWVRTLKGPNNIICRAWIWKARLWSIGDGFFLWRSYKVKWSSPLESFSWRWAGRLLFLAIFSSPFFRLLIFPFILICAHCPSSTYRVNLSKADTCPISPYPKSLGVVVKAGEYGSARFRTLNGSNSSFPWIF